MNKNTLIEIDRTMQNMISKLQQSILIITMFSLLTTLNAYEIIIDKSLSQNEKAEIKDILYPSIKDKYNNKYKEIESPYTGKIWLDRNLGAKRVCQSLDDTKCYGDYFQWGRKADGHEKQNSSITSSQSSNSTPSHSKFIKGWSDWISSQNDNLWQGLNGKNNPCPKGFRIPTIDELLAETVKQGLKNNKKFYNSFLKLPSAGYRKFYDGSMHRQGSWGRLWSSSLTGKDSFRLRFYSDAASKSYSDRANGFSVRCLKD